MRNRLIELIKNAPVWKNGTFDEACEFVADHLIQNGVVVIDTDVVSAQNRPLISHFAEKPIDEVIDLVRAKEEGRIIVPPCTVGDEVWVVEEDDVTCYMFLAKSKGCIIATSWINDYDVDETLEYHITETQDNLDTDLAVFPDEWCFVTKEAAEKALRGEGE